MSLVCIAHVFVPKVEADKWAEVPKVKLGEQELTVSKKYLAQGQSLYYKD